MSFFFPFDFECFGKETHWPKARSIAQMLDNYQACSSIRNVSTSKWLKLSFMHKTIFI